MHPYSSTSQGETHDTSSHPSTFYCQPYVDAGRQLHEYGVATYEALTSNTAKDIYKTIWILMQAAFWLSVLAALYTIKLGRQFKAYYNAEWATSVNGLVTYPDRCLKPETEELPTIDTITAIADLATETAAIPEALQTIVDSNISTTNKLRKIASYYKISWRNSRGNGKHATNSTIREALQARCPDVFAVL